MSDRAASDSDPRSGAEENLFATVLRPLAPQEFLEATWEARPRFIPASVDKLAHLAMDRGVFERAVAAAEPGYLKSASPSAATGESTYAIIDAADAWTSFDSGMTLCVTAIDNEVPTLRRLALDATRLLHLAGGAHCNCYMSPRGEGFGIHFDTQSIFLVQLEGSKRWKYGRRPAALFPREPADGSPSRRLKEYRERFPWLRVTDLDESEFEDCELNPGDVLYLPPGTWHQGRAGDYSLAVTLTCPTLSFSALLAGVLDDQLFQTLPWRRNLPAALSGQSKGESTALMQAFSQARMVEFHHAVSQLSPASLAAAWQSRLDDEHLI